MRLSGPSRRSVTFLNVPASSEVIAQVPRGSIWGGRVTAKGAPLTHTSRTADSSVNRSPSVMTKLATLPAAIVPCVFSMPSHVAGTVVSAASALSGVRPRATAVRRLGRNCVSDESPSAVMAKGTPAAASCAGLVGARYQWRRSASDTLVAASGLDTLGASGKVSGMTSGCVRPFSTSMRRYSCPLPRNHGVSL